MTGAKPSALEQQRRDFIQANRTLYEYIVALESAKVWDSAGDQASGTDDGMGLANRMWSRSSASSAKAHELAQSTVEGS